MSIPRTEQSNASRSSLPTTVRDALAQGRLIEAIKDLREAWGVGLKEAKDIVEAYERGDFLPHSAVLHQESRAPSALPRDVMDSLRAGNKIEAIGLLREHIPGLGLKEAKERVEASAEVMPRAQTGGRHMLAPGEVPRGSSSAALFVAGVLVLVVAAYYLWAL